MKDNARAAAVVGVVMVLFWVGGGDGDIDGIYIDTDGRLDDVDGYVGRLLIVISVVGLVVPGVL